MSMAKPIIQDSISGKEIWRQIAPEEKFDLIHRAHAKGVMVCLITFIIAGTLAVGLKASWIMWGGFVISPFVFQFASGKAWRTVRPRAMLEFLAARAAARRYAFMIQSKELELNLMFRSCLSHEFTDEEGRLKELEAAIEHTRETGVWVALFKDAVVMISEKAGGARLEFGHLIGSELKLETSSEQDEYSNARRLTLEYTDRRGTTVRVCLGGKYPAALAVFERRLRAQLHEGQAVGGERKDMMSEIPTDYDLDDGEERVDLR